MFVEELKREGNLPEEFLDVLPDTCPVCGSPMAITEGLSMLKCTNGVCPSKLTTRLCKLFEDLGVLGMGASRCAGLVKYHNATSPYIIFKLCHKDGTFDTFFDYYQINYGGEEPYIMQGRDKDSLAIEFTDFLVNTGVSEEQCKMQHVGMSEAVAKDIVTQVNKARSMLLYEFVRMGNYEGLRDSATQLFKDYNSLDDFYKDLDNGGIDFVKTKLGIKKAEGESIRANSIYATLIAAREELMEYIQYIDLKGATQVVNICISTAVGAPYKNKADFIRAMNDKYGDKMYLNKLGSVTKNCQYLVWSKVGEPTNKVKAATKLGIPILTGVEFDAMLNDMCK